MATAPRCVLHGQRRAARRPEKAAATRRSRQVANLRQIVILPGDVPAAVKQRSTAFFMNSSIATIRHAAPRPEQCAIMRRWRAAPICFLRSSAFWRRLFYDVRLPACRYAFATTPPPPDMPLPRARRSCPVFLRRRRRHFQHRPRHATIRLNTNLS